MYTLYTKKPGCKTTVFTGIYEVIKKIYMPIDPSWGAKSKGISQYSLMWIYGQCGPKCCENVAIFVIELMLKIFKTKYV